MGELVETVKHTTPVLTGAHVCTSVFSVQRYFEVVVGHFFVLAYEKLLVF